MRNHSAIFVCTGMLALVILAGCQRYNGNRVEAAVADMSAAVRLSQTDQQFITDAEKIHIEERAVGRLILEKSQNSHVRNYAQMLVDDHSKALRELVTLMEKKGMGQPSGLPEARSEALDELNNLSGARLNQRFAEMMIQGHEQAIQKFEMEAKSGQDPDVKDYASDVVPVLQKHLDKARELQRHLESMQHPT